MDDRLKSQNPNVRLQATPFDPQLEVPQGPNGSQPQFMSSPPDDNPYMAEDDDPYMAVDTIPNTENLLQKAIRQSRISPFGGTSITAALPTTGQEAMDLGKVALRQIVPDQSGLVGMGAKMAGVSGDINLPSPETEYGKNLEMSGNIAQLAHLGGSLGSGMMQGIKKVSQPFRTGPIKKEIRGVKELINQSKSLEVPINEEINQIERVGKGLKNRSNRSAEKLAYSGSKDINSKVEGAFKTARENYRKVLDEDVSDITVKDLTGVLDKTIEAKGLSGKEFMRPSESRLISLRREVASKIKEQVPDITETSRDPLTNAETVNVIKKGSEASNPEMSHITEIKDFKNRIFDSLGGDIDLEAEFLKHLNNLLKDKGITSFKPANDLYTKAYDLAKNVKKLRKPALKRVATGKASEPEISDLSNVEKKFGTDYIRKGTEDSKKNKLQQYALEQRKSKAESKLSAKKSEQDYLKSKIPDLESKIGDVRFRQAAAGATASTLGIGGLLAKLFSLDK